VSMNSPYPPRPSEVQPGFCHCGCGQKTNISPETDASKGWVKGQPLRFIFGHQARGHFGNYRKKDRIQIDSTTGCWNWLLRITKAGYGIGWYNGKFQYMHITLWEEKNGPVPDGLELDHTCRNRRCCNPDHVEPVTRAENVRRGSVAKLTKQDVFEIRRVWITAPTPATKRDLATRFGVHPTTINAVVMRHKWITDLGEDSSGIQNRR